MTKFFLLAAVALCTTSGIAEPTVTLGPQKGMSNLDFAESESRLFASNPKKYPQLAQASGQLAGSYLLAGVGMESTGNALDGILVKYFSDLSVARTYDAHNEAASATQVRLMPLQVAQNAVIIQLLKGKQ
jgi:hypothetical protein